MDASTNENIEFTCKMEILDKSAVLSEFLAKILTQFFANIEVSYHQKNKAYCNRSELGLYVLSLSLTL